MNVLLLIALIVVEIGLIVFTFVENRKKNIWTRNRLIANGIEILLFLLFVMFPGMEFGIRFNGLLILLIIRLIVSAITYLRKRNVQGDKKSAGAVASGIFGIVLFITAITPSFMFNDYQGRPVTGQYRLGKTQAILVDNNRIETYENDGSNRELPILVFYPEDASEGETFPLVVFSHGSFGYSNSNYSTYAELASNGYVVVSIDHPYHAFYCKDTNGKTITVNPEHYNSAMYVNSGRASESEIFELTTKWMELRTADMGFVIDTIEAYDVNREFTNTWYIASEEDREALQKALSMIDVKKIGLMGHSLGGAASELLGRTRSDIDAVIDLDGTMVGDNLELVDSEEYEFEGVTYNQKYIINEEPYPVALLSIDNEEHHFSRILADEIGMPYANNTVLENAVDGYETYFVGAGHMNFTDLPLFSPFLAGMFKADKIDAGECVDQMNELVLEFYDCKLKGAGNFEVKDCYGN